MLSPAVLHYRLVLAFSFLIFPLISFAQSQPGAIVAPVGALGEVKDTHKRFLQNELESELSKSYKLLKKEKFLEAKKQAFRELDVKECTEEQCYRKIQEILQTERIFVLQVVRDEELTQLKLMLIGLEENKVASTLCENCKITDLVGSVKELTKDVRDQDLPKEESDTSVSSVPIPVPIPDVIPDSLPSTSLVPVVIPESKKFG